MKTVDKDGGVVNGAGKALLLLCVIGFPEEAQKQKQVGGVNKCGHSEPPPPSARPPTPEPDIRDQARKARDKLDDLAHGDHLLPRKGDLEQGGSIVGVHHDVDQGVEPHAIHADDDAVLQPHPHLVHHGRVMPHVQQRGPAAAKDQQRGIGQLVQLGQEEDVLPPLHVARDVARRAHRARPPVGARHARDGQRGAAVHVQRREREEDVVRRGEQDEGARRGEGRPVAAHVAVQQRGQEQVGGRGEEQVRQVGQGRRRPRAGGQAPEERA